MFRSNHEAGGHLSEPAAEPVTRTRAIGFSRRRSAGVTRPWRRPVHCRSTTNTRRRPALQGGAYERTDRIQFWGPARQRPSTRPLPCAAPRHWPAGCPDRGDLYCRRRAHFPRPRLRILKSSSRFVDGPQRSAAHKARDKYRHPVETLAFFGIRSNMTGVGVWPFGGWYTDRSSHRTSRGRARSTPRRWIQLPTTRKTSNTTPS